MTLGKVELNRNLNVSSLYFPFEALSNLFSPNFCSSILFYFLFILSLFEVFKKRNACNFYVIRIFVLTVDKQNITVSFDIYFDKYL